jgi:hypothetical protein
MVRFGVLVVAVLTIGTGVAQGGATRGDAVALLNAGTTGGLRGQGTPSDRRIRIGPGQNFNGAHVCAEDWHLLSTFLVVTDGTDGVATVAEARALFSTIEVTYERDGAPLVVESTAVKPWLGDITSLDPAATVAFGRNTGAVLSPDELTVGAHTQRVRIFTEGELFIDFGNVTFVVDAPGSGVCV